MRRTVPTFEEYVMEQYGVDLNAVDPMDMGSDEEYERFFEDAVSSYDEAFGC